MEAPMGETVGADDRKVWRVSIMASGAGGRGINADGSVSLDLLPGKYDLEITVRNENGTYQQPIQVQEGCALEENKTQTLEIK
ncbi:MAG: hypothetical protein NT018_08700 [Armatimonadetes bacterium]|nr:hypothetical protein [Armatimonadota bacterium]